MKRGLQVLILAISLFAISSFLYYHIHMQTPSGEWMGSRLGLSGEQLNSFVEAHNRYLEECAERCEKIAAAEESLALEIARHDQLEPEVMAVLAQLNTLGNECQENMLRHFFEVAAILPEHKRDVYLEMVLPLVINSSSMAQRHGHP